LPHDRQDRPDRIGRVDRPLVDHVIQTPADQGRDRDDDQGIPDDLGVLVAPLRLVHEDEVHGGETDRIEDAVPEHRERPDREGDGIGREVDHAGRVYVE
jgi:hypothetical protein